MRNSSHLKLFAALAALVVAACATPSKPQQDPLIDTMPGWIHLPDTIEAANKEAPLVTSTAAAVEHDWWRNFGDPTLDALVKESLTNNRTLAIAKARVEEARAS